METGPMMGVSLEVCLPHPTVRRRGPFRKNDLWRTLPSLEYNSVLPIDRSNRKGGRPATGCYRNCFVPQA